jgi:hypothetical protein
VLRGYTAQHPISGPTIVEYIAAKVAALQSEKLIGQLSFSISGSAPVDVSSSFSSASVSQGAGSI